MAIPILPPGDKRCSRCGPPRRWRRWLPWRRRLALCKTCLDKFTAEMHGDLLKQDPVTGRIVDTLMPNDPSQN
jgi:hypothetical protein